MLGDAASSRGWESMLASQPHDRERYSSLYNINPLNYIYNSYQSRILSPGLLTTNAVCGYMYRIIAVDMLCQPPGPAGYAVDVDGLTSRPSLGVKVQIQRHHSFPMGILSGRETVY